MCTTSHPKGCEAIGSPGSTAFRCFVHTSEAVASGDYGRDQKGVHTCTCAHTNTRARAHGHEYRINNALYPPWQATVRLITSAGFYRIANQGWKLMGIKTAFCPPPRLQVRPTILPPSRLPPLFPLLAVQWVGGWVRVCWQADRQIDRKTGRQTNGHTHLSLDVLPYLHVYVRAEREMLRIPPSLLKLPLSKPQLR